MDAVELGTFAEVVGGRVVGGVPAGDGVVVENVATHSGHIRENAAFFALPGRHQDGHAFVRDALTNGAAAAVVGDDHARDVGDVGPLVVVDDPLRALRRLAAWWRSRITARVVAVVGTAGKTVTKDALVELLSARHPTYGSPGSWNSRLGVPLSILDCPRDVEFAVFEAAVSEPGEMRRHRELVAPDHVVLTTMHSRFVENFDGADRQARELLDMAHDLTPDGWLLLGTATDELVRLARSLPCPHHVLGDSGDLPKFSDPLLVGDGAQFTGTFPDGAHGTMHVRASSDEIATDVMVAVAAATLLGLPGPDALARAADYRPTSARIEVWRSPGGFTVVRDLAVPRQFNLGEAIRLARRLGGAGSRTTVLLADEYVGIGESTGRALGRALARSALDTLITLDVPGHAAITAGCAEVDPDLQVLAFEHERDVRDHLGRSLTPEDVLVVGSPPDRTLAQTLPDALDPIGANRMTIDLNAIEHNLLEFRRTVGDDVRVMVMVKALGYGTDPTHISRELEQIGVDFLGVATTDEGIALRQARVRVPILVTLPDPADVERLARHGLTPLLYSPQMVTAAAEHAGSRVLDAHVELETGMHRTGLSAAEALAAVDRLDRGGTVRVTGVMTHFACADDPGKDAVTRAQLERFTSFCTELEARGHRHLLRHAANTAGAIRFPAARLDMVRVGIGLYGVDPRSGDDETRGPDLHTAVSLVSRIVAIHTLRGGDHVGYGATFTAGHGSTRIGVVAAGYHDCVPRAFSNHGYVVIAGRRCPIVGTVSMDSMTIDLTSCPEATVGSDVLVFGHHGSSNVPIEQVARAIDTIPYELLTRVGPRVQRVFARY